MQVVLLILILRRSSVATLCNEIERARLLLLSVRNLLESFLLWHSLLAEAQTLIFILRLRNGALFRLLLSFLDCLLLYFGLFDLLFVDLFLLSLVGDP